MSIEGTAHNRAYMAPLRFAQIPPSAELQIRSKRYTQFVHGANTKFEGAKMKGNKNNKRKIPGMLYILVSFIPWIVYWILSGMGYKAGIIIPLAISFLLIISQIRKRDFNLMDLISVSYFSIATAGTFVFNLNVFVERSGFLGYSVK